jgi:hypothetical protein
MAWNGSNLVNVDFGLSVSRYTKNFFFLLFRFPGTAWRILTELFLFLGVVQRDNLEGFVPDQRCLFGLYKLVIANSLVYLSPDPGCLWPLSVGNVSLRKTRPSSYRFVLFPPYFLCHGPNAAVLGTGGYHFPFFCRSKSWHQCISVFVIVINIIVHRTDLFNSLCLMIIINNAKTWWICTKYVYLES